VRNALASKGVVLGGLEIGNEVNWAAFNGDLPVGDGRTFFANRADLTSENGRAILVGFDRLAEAIKQIGQSVPDRKFPLLAAGLAPYVKDWKGPPQASAVALGLSADLLLERGIARIADGISVHFYPAARDKSDQTCLAWYEDRKSALSFCKRPGGASCWITEIGIRTAGPACEPEGFRRRSFRCLRDSLVAINREFLVDRVYLYTWSESANGPMSLSRGGVVCGEAAEFFKP
jgi:hypothetical protein